MRRESPFSEEFIKAVDNAVGDRLRMQRQLLGLSEAKLGKSIGVSFQQIQKYEKASNRLSVSTLYCLAQCLGIEVEWFFKDLKIETPSICTNKIKLKSSLNEDIVCRHESLDLLRNYYSLDEGQRDSVFALIKSMNVKSRYA